MQRAKREIESLRNSDDAKRKGCKSCICWLCRLDRSGGWFSSISSTLNRSSAMCTFLRRSFLVIYRLHFGWPGSLNMQVTTYQRSGGPPVHQFRWLGPLNNRLVPRQKSHNSICLRKEKRALEGGAALSLKLSAWLQTLWRSRSEVPLGRVRGWRRDCEKPSSRGESSLRPRIGGPMIMPMRECDFKLHFDKSALLKDHILPRSVCFSSKFCPCTFPFPCIALFLSVGGEVLLSL